MLPGGYLSFDSDSIGIAHSRTFFESYESGDAHILPKSTLGVVVPQSSEQKTCRLGIGVPFFRSGGFAELGKPLEKADKSFT